MVVKLGQIARLYFVPTENFCGQLKLRDSLIASQRMICAYFEAKKCSFIETPMQPLLLSIK